LIYNDLRVQTRFGLTSVDFWNCSATTLLRAGPVSARLQ
jgi:hypothetical protein